MSVAPGPGRPQPLQRHHCLADLVRVAALSGRCCFSFGAGLRGSLSLQGSLGRPDRGQPALPTGQLDRELITAAVRPVRGVLSRVDPLRLGQ